MKILLGIGGRDDAFTALDRAVTRAREAGDELTVAVVENPDATLSVAEVEAAVTDRLEEAEMEADVVMLEGHAGSRLVEFAESGGYDRIVLGGGETSPLGKVSLGSIAEFVILNANTSVTLVR